MLGLYDHHHPLRLQRVVDALHDLFRQAFLYLQPMGVDVHDTGDFAQSRDVSVRDVRHVRLAIEWQHVMLAHGEEVNVLDNDHLIVFFFKQRIGQYFVRILRIAACQYLHSFGNTHRGLLQSLSFRVLS